jgi:hypothetical protein
MRDGSVKTIQIHHGEPMRNALAAVLASHVQLAIGLTKNIRLECQPDIAV